MNKFFSKIILLVKILISLFLISIALPPYNYSNSVLPNYGYKMNFISALIILFFFTLPTLFVFFLKNKVIARYPKFAKVWKYLSIIYIILVIVFLGLVALGAYRLYDKTRTNKVVSFINGQKITLSDVMGNNLPLKPDQNLNDSTIAGIDANNNFIRDDVELAIFEKYPNSAKIRAAELQYAQALQLELTQVFNSETLVATLQKGSLGIDCVGGTGPDISLKSSHEEIIAGLAVGDDRIKETKGLVMNTDMRKNKESDDLSKYMTTYSSSINKQECNIDPLILPN